MSLHLRIFLRVHDSRDRNTKVRGWPPKVWHEDVSKCGALKSNNVAADVRVEHR